MSGLSFETKLTLALILFGIIIVVLETIILLDVVG